MDTTLMERRRRNSIPVVYRFQLPPPPFNWSSDNRLFVFVMSPKIYSSPPLLFPPLVRRLFDNLKSGPLRCTIFLGFFMTRDIRKYAYSPRFICRVGPQLDHRPKPRRRHLRG